MRRYLRLACCALIFGCLPAKAQRTLRFYEPDFDYQYCLKTEPYANLLNENLLPVSFSDFAARPETKGNFSLETRMLRMLKFSASDTDAVSHYDYKQGFLRQDTVDKFQTPVSRVYTYTYGGPFTTIRIHNLEVKDSLPARWSKLCTFQKGNDLSVKIISDRSNEIDTVHFTYDSLSRLQTIQSANQFYRVAYRSLDNCRENISIYSKELLKHIHRREHFDLETIEIREDDGFSKLLVTGKRFIGVLRTENGKQWRYCLDFYRFRRKGKCRSVFSRSTMLLSTRESIQEEHFKAFRRGRKWIFEGKFLKDTFYRTVPVSHIYRRTPLK